MRSDSSFRATFGYDIKEGAFIAFEKNDGGLVSPFSEGEGIRLP
jgi:hypothetical protein